MIKGYQGDELWTAVNPATGNREIVDPEGEFIPGETIIKLYYWKRIDGYVTIPGDSLFKVAADGYTSNLLAKDLSQTTSAQAKRTCAWSPIQEGAV
jgi:hypothetical protein